MKTPEDKRRAQMGVDILDVREAFDEASNTWDAWDCPPDDDADGWNPTEADVVSMVLEACDKADALRRKLART